jgi:hypothetical protein
MHTHTHTNRQHGQPSLQYTKLECSNQEAVALSMRVTSWSTCVCLLHTQAANTQSTTELTHTFPITQGGARAQSRNVRLLNSGSGDALLAFRTSRIARWPRDGALLGSSRLFHHAYRRWKPIIKSSACLEPGKGTSLRVT